jgi:hypothetical protein
VHTALSAAFYLLQTAVGDGAMRKFGICFQWRNEHFKARMLFFSVGKGAMNAPRYWQPRDTNALYRLRDETSANTPRLSYPNGAMNS